MEYTFSNKMAALKPSAIREIFKSLTDPTIISFAAGNPAPESFPLSEMARLSASIYETEAAKALQYGVTDGYEPLRSAITARQIEKGYGTVHSKAEGDGYDDTAIIVSGGQQGIELACKIFSRFGCKHSANFLSFL